MTNCIPANVTSLDVYYMDGYHIVIAKGTRTSEWEIPKIVQLPNDIYPPQFRVELCGKGLKKGTNFKVSRAFRFGEKQDQLTIHTADGAQVVPVHIFDKKSAKVVRTEKMSTYKESEGKSYNMSFEEAYDNAVNNFMDTYSMPVKDSMVQSELISVKSNHGEITGINVMTVKIKAMYCI